MFGSPAHLHSLPASQQHPCSGQSLSLCIHLSPYRLDNPHPAPCTPSPISDLSQPACGQSLSSQSGHRQLSHEAVLCFFRIAAPHSARSSCCHRILLCCRIFHSRTSTISAFTSGAGTKGCFIVFAVLVTGIVIRKGERFAADSVGADRDALPAASVGFFRFSSFGSRGPQVIDDSGRYVPVVQRFKCSAAHHIFGLCPMLLSFELRKHFFCVSAQKPPANIVVPEPEFTPVIGVCQAIFSIPTDDVIHFSVLSLPSSSL